MITFVFNDTATTEIYTLSLHDALPISTQDARIKLRSLYPSAHASQRTRQTKPVFWSNRTKQPYRSEEHTSELQSRQYLVCRLLLEKKKETAAVAHLQAAIGLDDLALRL